MIVVATLIARDTADGTDFIKSDVPLGKEYLIDLERMWERPWGKEGREGCIMRETVALVDWHGNVEGWLPTEILSWEGK